MTHGWKKEWNDGTQYISLDNVGKTIIKSPDEIPGYKVVGNTIVKDENALKEDYDDYDEDDEYDDEEISWEEEYFEHPACEAYEEACEELGVKGEPSTQGRMGSVYYYSTKKEDNNKTLYLTNYDEECDFMDDIGYRIIDGELSEDEAKEEIKDWIVSNPYDDVEESLNEEVNRIPDITWKEAEKYFGKDFITLELLGPNHIGIVYHDKRLADEEDDKQETEYTIDDEGHIYRFDDSRLINEDYSDDEDIDENEPIYSSEEWGELDLFVSDMEGDYQFELMYSEESIFGYGYTIGEVIQDFIDQVKSELTYCCDENCTIDKVIVNLKNARKWEAWRSDLTVQEVIDKLQSMNKFKKANDMYGVDYDQYFVEDGTFEVYQKKEHHKKNYKQDDVNKWWE